MAAPSLQKSTARRLIRVKSIATRRRLEANGKQRAEKQASVFMNKLSIKSNARLSLSANVTVDI